MVKRLKYPGNAKQRKAINKLASSGDIRGAVELLKQIDPGAKNIKIQPATGSNLRPNRV
jgi:hypothetical protein